MIQIDDTIHVHSALSAHIHACMHTGYIVIYIHTHNWTHTDHTCIRAYILAHMLQAYHTCGLYIQTLLSMHVHICMDAHTYRSYIHTGIQPVIQRHIHTYIHFIHVDHTCVQMIHTYIQAYIHT